MEYEVFVNELLKRKERVYSYLSSSRFRELFRPKHINDSVYSYMKQGGKSLRPAVLLFSCGGIVRGAAALPSMRSFGGGLLAS